MAQKNYFTQDTENAIIAYNKSQNPRVKSKIYEDKIHYPFFKLTENLIHTYKFYYTEVENLEDLQHEIIVFLLSKIHLYDHVKNINDKIKKITKKYGQDYEDESFNKFVGDVDRVSQEQINTFIKNLPLKNNDSIYDCLLELEKITPPKAYSYFGTVAKNWLIIYNDKNFQKRKNQFSIETIYDDENFSYNIKSSDDSLSYFLDEFIIYMEKNLNKFFPKEKDKQIADAILIILKQREGISIFQKKALYVYIKEIVYAKTPKITKIASQIYKVFKKHYAFYIENGYTNF